jgi:tetratricopeptide (TPR) repeat protein
MLIRLPIIEFACTAEAQNARTLQGGCRSALRTAALLIAVLLVHAGSVGNARGEDRVVIQPEGSSSRISIRGQIQDYTGRSITLSVGPGDVLKSYPSSQVVEVETPQIPEHRHALKLYAEEQIPKAKESFESALGAESRLWVRREILADLIRCALRLGDFSSAGSNFLALVRSDHHTRHFHLIPLLWTARDSHHAQKADARIWMLNEGEAERLLGASHLLFDERYGQAAETELNKLCRSTDLRVQQLAHSQLWRLRLRSADISDREIERWQSHVDAMHEELRGGPYFVLGQGHLRRREHERAAAALLWVPLIYDHDYLLAAQACVEAAEALAQVGRRSAAITLYQETLTRFADSTFAEEARQALQAMAK